MIGLFITTAGLKLSFRLVGAPTSWARAFLAVVIIYPTGMFVTFISAFILSPPLGLLVGLFAVLAVLKALFGATWPQTLLIWLLMTVIQIILMVAAGLLAGWGLQELMRQLHHYLPNREIEIGLGRFLLGMN